MYISKKHLSRRTVLRGMGASVALPFLDAMVPAQTPIDRTAARPKSRLAAIEIVHGSAGSTIDGGAKHYWSPVKEGADFEFTPILKPLERHRDYLTIVSHTDQQTPPRPRCPKRAAITIGPRPCSSRRPGPS